MTSQQWKMRTANQALKWNNRNLKASRFTVLKLLMNFRSRITTYFYLRFLVITRPVRLQPHRKVVKIPVDSCSNNSFLSSRVWLLRNGLLLLLKSLKTKLIREITKIATKIIMIIRKKLTLRRYKLWINMTRKSSLPKTFSTAKSSLMRSWWLISIYSRWLRLQGRYAMKTNSLSQRRLRNSLSNVREALSL